MVTAEVWGLLVAVLAGAGLGAAITQATASIHLRFLRDRARKESARALRKALEEMESESEHTDQSVCTMTMEYSMQEGEYDRAKKTIESVGRRSLGGRARAVLNRSDEIVEERLQAAGHEK